MFRPFAIHVSERRARASLLKHRQNGPPSLPIRFPKQVVKFWNAQRNYCIVHYAVCVLTTLSDLQFLVQLRKLPSWHGISSSLRKLAPLRGQWDGMVPPTDVQVPNVWTSRDKSLLWEAGDKRPFARFST